MTKLSNVALAAIVVLAGFAAVGSASAAKPQDGGFSPDGIEQECVFVSDLGKYVCQTNRAIVAASLTGPVSEPGRKLKVEFLPQNPGFPYLP